MSFTQTPEHLALRQAVAQLGGSYGYDYMVTKARAGGDMCELYSESGKLGYLGINLPTEYGGGGGGMYELAIVEEEFGAAPHHHHRPSRRRRLDTQRCQDLHLRRRRRQQRAGGGPNRGLDHRRPQACLLYTSPSPRDRTRSRMPSSA